MTNEMLLPLTGILAFILWLAVRHALAVARGERQREIARSGATTYGKIVAIQGPFLFDDCTRLYFDFVPDGGDRPLRACHIERKSLVDLRASLPVAGATVAIHYMPRSPRRAVIARLVVVHNKEATTY
jgi:hypothetical protein